ncbi:hypothetical protein AAHC03_019371 [Spirometra sp. Aus1]
MAQLSWSFANKPYFTSDLIPLSMQRRPLTRIELSWDDIENYEKFMKSKNASSLRSAQVSDQGHEQVTPSQPIRKSNRRRLDSPDTDA